MKRLHVSACVLSFLVLFSLIVPSYAQSNPQPETKASILQLCYKLWKQANFGWNEKQTERAAWIIRDRDGSYRWVEWNSAPKFRAATWNGPVPSGVVAQIHTHPAFNDPKPSKQDARVAKDIQGPVYTVSGHGIWKVGPDGKVTKEADDTWFRQIQ